MEIKALYKKFLKHKKISAPKNKVQSKKPIAISGRGLWDKSKKKVIVPSNRITMKGPKGEQDFFKRPVLATGLQSGKKVMMQPGREYYFPEDEAVLEKQMQNGGLFSEDPSTKLSASDEEKFSQFFATLPSNLKVDNNSYDIRGYWDALGRPDAFDYSQPKEDDDMHHAFSRHPRSGKMLKSMSHPTAQMAVEGDKAAGYSHAMDPRGGVYSFSPEDMPTEGPYSFKDGGKKVRFPKFKSFLRTSPAGNAGYSDNTRVAPQVKPEEIRKNSEDYLENFERIEQVEVKAKRKPKKTISLKEAYDAFKNRPKYRFGESNTAESTRVDRVNPEVSAYPPEYFTAKGDRDGIAKKVIDTYLKGLPTNVASLARVALQQDNTQANIKDDELKVLGSAINSAVQEGKESGGYGTFGYENYPGKRKPISEVYSNLLGYKEKGFKQTVKDRLKAAATDSKYRKTVSDAFSDPSFQMQTTVGQGKFKKLPNGDYLVYDDYDFNFHSEGDKQNLLNDLEDKAGESDLFHSKTAYIVPKSYVGEDTGYTEREAGYLKKAEQEALASKPIVEGPIQQTVSQPIQQPKTISTMSSDTTKVNPTPTKTKALTGERLKVQNYQKMLNEKYSAGLDPDGAWGPKTQAAYEKYVLNKQMQGGGTVRTSMVEEMNQEDSLPILLDTLFSQFQKTRQNFGVEPEEGKQMQDGAETSTEENPVRMNPIDIAAKRRNPNYRTYLDNTINNNQIVPSEFRGRRYVQPTLSEYVEPSVGDRILSTLASPMTALSNNRTGSRNPYDYALDMVNPFSWIQSGERAVGSLAEGQYTDAALNALGAIPALGFADDAGRAISKVGKYTNKQINKNPRLASSLQNATSSVDDVGRVVADTPQPWQMQELPGLHLKSTMEGEAISKIIEPKTGLINTEQALAIIGKESGGADKVALIRQGLGENIPKKMDYNEFRKTVQDQLIPLEKQFSTERSEYGIDRIGYGPGKFVTKEVDGKKIHTYESDYLDNQTLILGNKNKFGRGSSAHGNPEETLGHAHYLIDRESPDVLTVTQIQSDAFQGTNRTMPRNMEGAIQKLNKTKSDSEYILELMGDEKEKFKAVFDNADKHLQLDQATVENFTQKQLLDKNHQERYLQELVDYAGKRGDMNKVRVPTSETAAKVQGYSKNTASGMDEMGLPTELGYSSEHQTILKKYSEQPKTIKKLFGKEPTIVTDNKGNTWYEFDIPEKFKQGKGEIKAFGLAPIGVGLGVGASQMNRQKSGMQMGGMSIPGVNGTVVASSPSLYSKAKKRKK
jgi:hypothetical protein